MKKKEVIYLHWQFEGDNLHEVSLVNWQADSSSTYQHKVCFTPTTSLDCTCMNGVTEFSFYKKICTR